MNAHRAAEAHAAEMFARDTTEHVMTVLHDDGLYRHLRFKAPGTSAYWFELVTWPGHITITGDMGTSTFHRERDMIPWVADGGARPDYWSQKLTERAGITEWCPALFREVVTELVAEYDGPLSRDSLKSLVNSTLLGPGTLEDERTARDAAEAFTHGSFSFTDVWEWDLQVFTFHYLWRCYAMRWGVEQYLAHAAAPTPEPAHA